VIGAEVDTTTLIRRLDALRSKDIPRAVASALSRSGTTVRARVQRLIRDDLALKASLIRGAISIEKSKPVDGASKAFITLRARGGPISLREYGARHTQRGTTYKIRKRDKRKVYKSAGRKGFIVGTRDRQGRLTSTNVEYGGHVYVRRSDGGFRKVFGPGIAIKVAGRRARTLAGDTFKERFQIEFRAVLGEFIRRQQRGLK